MRFMPPLLSVLLAACGASSHSHYAGLENRDIKALSDTDMARYQNGEGGGDALAAELNGLAGPKHVLELAAQLQLTPLQLSKTRALFDEMQKDAKAHGAALIRQERKLDKMFVARADGKQVRAVVLAIGELRARIRYAHLSAHLRQDALLNEEQRRMYVKLRGYHNHNH